jgi:hypothetical protein
MPLPIERWARQAVDLEYAGRPDKLVADKRVLRDIDDLKVLHQATHKRRMREMRSEGFPMAMAEGTYGAMMAYPPAQIGTTAWTTGGTAISGTTLGASTNVALTARRRMTIRCCNRSGSPRRCRSPGRGRRSSSTSPR